MRKMVKFPLMRRLKSVRDYFLVRLRLRPHLFLFNKKVNPRKASSLNKKNILIAKLISGDLKCAFKTPGNKMATSVSLVFSLATLFILTCCSDRHLGSKENVIYGENGISVVTGKKNQIWSTEFSAVSLVTEKSKLMIGRHRVLIRPQSSVTDKICAGEPLKDAFSMGHCTGFLLEEDTLVTAKHCLEVVQGGCDNLAFVFDAYSKANLSRPNGFHLDHVYTCKRARYPSDQALDLVLIELDRKTGRKPLTLLPTDKWDDIGELIVLGYPLGGRQRVARGGKFRSASEMIYRAELDVFEGNSGSPILASDRSVRGIIVDGERDFEPTEQGCLKVKRCDSGGCLGEGFIPSEKIMTFLDQIKVLKDIEAAPKDQIFVEKKSEKIMIPDDEQSVAEIKFFIERSEIASQINLRLSLSHPNPADLLIFVVSPSGKILNLFNRSGEAAGKTQFEFSSSDPQSPLYDLLGESSQGIWSVIVKDFRATAAGYVTGVELEIYSSRSKIL